MLRIGIIRESAKRISDAVGETVTALKVKRIEQETAFTDRMLGTIEYVMKEYSVKGIRWTAKTLTDKGPGAQEREYGADFIGVLNIQIENFEVRKGFLAQSKLLEPDKHFSKNEMVRMRQQCEKMLQYSPDSFLFVYSSRSVIVVPAISIISGEANPYAYYNRSVGRFFEEHFESFIGDPRISTPHISNLEKLRKEYEARSALLLEARTENRREKMNNA